jgi:hypothetical protein
VGERPDPTAAYEITCPHCGTSFVAEPMVGDAARYEGFKCPRCRLFVPFQRAEEQDLVEQIDEPLQQ